MTDPTTIFLTRTSLQTVNHVVKQKVALRLANGEKIIY